jgi:hypothetical protein
MASTAAAMEQYRALGPAAELAKKEFDGLWWLAGLGFSGPMVLSLILGNVFSIEVARPPLILAGFALVYAITWWAKRVWMRTHGATMAERERLAAMLRAQGVNPDTIL